MKQMYIRFIFNFILLASSITIMSCTDVESREKGPSPVLTTAFSDYWFQGRAELTRFDLQQARYGEIHRGDAVLIYVTEDFLPDLQVKYEYGNTSSEPAAILKLNFTRKFYTGVYPYSIMTSVFSPLDSKADHSFKITSSSQEWCGHTYMQLNNSDQKFRVRLYSYFQNEADQQLELSPGLLEDDLWTKIRLNPSGLPLGEIEIYPGLQYVRLSHKKFKQQKALASLQSINDPGLSNQKIMAYRIDYMDLDRILEIKFEESFPHAIVAWEETISSGFNRPGKLVTKAVKKKSILLDYWTKNSVADSTFRILLEE